MSQDKSYGPGVHRRHGGNEIVIAGTGAPNTGTMTIEEGAIVNDQRAINKGFIPIDILSNRLLSTNAIANTIEGFTADGNTAPSLARVNAATDKALRIVMAANTTDELQFAPIPLPPDLDDTQDVTVHLLAGKGTNTDTTNTIDIQVFFGLGDTECGGATAAMNATEVSEYFATVAAADVPAHPNVMNISLVPGAHANDAIHIYSAWVEYTKKTS